MKKLFILGAFALLSSTLFSCTADEALSDNKTKTDVPAYADGPGDLPIKVPPPPQ